MNSWSKDFTSGVLSLSTSISKFELLIELSSFLSYGVLPEPLEFKGFFNSFYAYGILKVDWYWYVLGYKIVGYALRFKYGPQSPPLPI